MTDVDKGSWSYVTNGFGELISQTNAIPQTTYFEYNNAGQMLRRYDASGTVCWSYGSAAASYNVNQLMGGRPVRLFYCCKLSVLVSLPELLYL